MRRNLKFFLLLFVVAAILWFLFITVWGGFDERQYEHYEGALKLSENGRWSDVYPGSMPERPLPPPREDSNQ